MELYENYIGIRFKVSVIVATGRIAWRNKMFTKSANWFRQELWKHRNFQQGDTLAGLDESDLEWLTKQILKTKEEDCQG